MTATVTQTETDRVATSWLGNFEAALAAADAERAAALFTEDSFWRDLIAFTWNIKTVEGRAGIMDLVTETAARVQPSNWRIAEGEQATDAGGIIEAWIEFDTSVGRGRGHLRLRDGLGWMLLTTLYELTGHEEPRGEQRPKGPSMGSTAGA